MSYRTWPAAMITGAALAAATVVVGDHAVGTSDRCLGSVGWFVATPVTAASATGASSTAATAPVIPDLDSIPSPSKAGIGPAKTNGQGQIRAGRQSPELEISGCLDVARIEVPGQGPVPDGRA